MKPAHSVILGVPISTLGMQSALELCAARAAQRSGGYVCFANVHTVTESQKLPELKRALSGAFLSVADGLPLVWVSRLRDSPIDSRVCGPDFMKLFLEKQTDFVSGFIGGAAGQAEKLAGRFKLDAICTSPPMRPFSKEAALDDWKDFVRRNEDRPLPAVVWVGLGAPKQELWMQAVSSVVPNVLFFGVGAAFDFLTGTKKRAPIWMQACGLEWFYRLLKEPRRLWRRYFATNSRFLGYLIRNLLSP